MAAGSSSREEASFPLTEVDKLVLSQTDDEYKCHTWDELKSILESNTLDVLRRRPSDLRRYMKWSADTKAEYGSMTNFLLARRLPTAWGQPPFSPASTVPFQDPSDYRVLLNDWPYAFTEGIIHMVVWSRTPISTDPETGDMTSESRKTIADFVNRFFVRQLGGGEESRVLWFKNWAALQSVRSLEHIHVVVKDIESAILHGWTQERAEHIFQKT